MLSFVFGAIVGSFLNVCITRIPNGESVVHPRSRCPKCRKPIPFYCNLPLLSYAFLRGRCRSCGERISARYFLVEFLMGLLALTLYYRFGLSFDLFVGFVFVGALLVVSFIDLDVRIVPNVISLPGIVLGFVFSLLGHFFFGTDHNLLPSPLSSLIGIVAGGGFLLVTAWLYEKLTGVEGMGGGDIKLLAMIGAFLGWQAVLVTLFAASLLGSIVGLTCMLLTGAGRRMALPFAPFLCSGALVSIYLGDEIIRFYLPSS